MFDHLMKSGAVYAPRDSNCKPSREHLMEKCLVKKDQNTKQQVTS